ncbi:hypothetical protein [Aliiglaciecola sp. M165]|uniref:hypothetical protein n=1 Tax=Aliiglaciecola sp. M165 TaxID=2593649 RepID=UPI00117F8477|nr:hypothetical protein [Aliiglaciecola sp. M165]TRY30733.1 hypothetical protein FM019_12645 [Aliiglaciecola sp. M165]
MNQIQLDTRICDVYCLFEQALSIVTCQKYISTTSNQKEIKDRLNVFHHVEVKMKSLIEDLKIFNENELKSAGFSELFRANKALWQINSMVESIMEDYSDLVPNQTELDGAQIVSLFAMHSALFKAGEAFDDLLLNPKKKAA